MPGLRSPGDAARALWLRGVRRAPAGTLESTELVAAGSVRATAMVHRHHKPDPATPFTVVEVVLDGGGPALKGVLAPGLDPPAIGERVSGAVLDGRLIWEREG